MFSRLRLSHRIAIALVIPILGLLTLSALDIRTQYVRTAQMELVVEIADTMSGLSDLSHALQFERGSNSGFIAAGGGNGPAVLAEARAATDAAIRKVADTTP